MENRLLTVSHSLPSSHHKWAKMNKNHQMISVYITLRSSSILYTDSTGERNKSAHGYMVKMPWNHAVAITLFYRFGERTSKPRQL